MSKEGSKEVFDLIKSLNRSEKGYFKKFAARHTIGEKNIYVRLFDVIDNQKKYDEEKIIKKEPAVKKQQLPNLKGYLHDLILRSLDNYYSDNNTEQVIKKLIRNISILYEKSLYDQCGKLLTQAKKIAQRHEKHLLILELLRWEKRIVHAQADIEKLKTTANEIFEEEQKTVGKLQNLSYYMNLTSKMVLAETNRGAIRNKREIKRLNRLIKVPLLKHENKAASYESKYYFYSIYCLYFLANGNRVSYYNYATKLIRLIESHPGHTNDGIKDYISVLNNFTIAQVNLKKYNEAIDSIHKLRALSGTNAGKKSAEVQLRIFVRSFDLEMDMYVKSGQFAKGLAAIKSLETGLQNFEGRINNLHTILLYYNAAALFFGAGHYKKAAQWLNKILNEANADMRQDLQCFARIVNVIVHYELGNEELLPYLLKSTYRFLLKRDRLYKFESIILKYIKNLHLVGIQKNNLINSFSLLRKELIKISKDPFEKKALDYFDFISWLESKIQNRPFAEIVRGKAEINTP